MTTPNNAGFLFVSQEDILCILNLSKMRIEGISREQAGLSGSMPVQKTKKPLSKADEELKINYSIQLRELTIEHDRLLQIQGRITQLGAEIVHRS